MKEEFHAKFAATLHIILLMRKAGLFNNRIAITFNLANLGKKTNWRFIMLTQHHETDWV
jgi:hypothetical protein